MDEIREEFEKWQDKINSNYLSCTKYEYYRAGYKSRDEEIKKLKQDCKNLIEINNNQADYVKSKDEEIKKLRDTLKYIVALAETLEDAERAASEALKDGE